MDRMRFFFFFVLVAGIAAVVYLRVQSRPQTQIQSILPSPSPIATVIPTLSPSTTSIFIPYWSDFDEPLQMQDYQRVIYFGIVPTRQGIDTAEPGYRNLKKFIDRVGASPQKLLTIRMVERQEDTEIVKDKRSWEKIVDETITTAREYGFNGVVLDLEVKALPFDDLVEDVNSFVEYFYTRTKDAGFHFALTIYGDTFYRKRPYDIHYLSQITDEIIVMGYDIHKAAGEPGPNFPLRGKTKFDYDIETFLQDLGSVPEQKVSWIFGMYGYDWVVDEKKRPIKQAKPLSYLEIKKQFIDKCEWKNCVALRNETAAETEVNYVDQNLLYHIVWFEDPESVVRKKEFLKKNGISNIIYWAYGYF